MKAIGVWTLSDKQAALYSELLAALKAHQEERVNQIRDDSEATLFVLAARVLIKAQALSESQ